MRGIATLRCAGALTAVALVVGCTPDAPVIDTTLTFDGQTRTISTDEVSCTRFPDGPLVILVNGGHQESVRAVVYTRGRLVVDRIGLRHHDLAGFVADPAEVDAMKVDDTYTFSGPMPPNRGETQAHRVEVTVTCPGYVAPPTSTPRLVPPRFN